MSSGYQIEKYLNKSKNKVPFIIRHKNNLNKSDWKYNSVGVINLQSSNAVGNGTHWTGYYIPAKSISDNVFYFDSYGAPPPEAVVKFLKNGDPNKKIIYSDQQIQKLDSDTCGEFVMYFLTIMKNNIATRNDSMLKDKYLDFIYNIFDPRDLDYNEKFVKSKITLRSPKTISN